MKFFIAASKITFNHILKKNYVHWKLISKSKEPVKVGTIFHAEYLAPNDQSYQGIFVYPVGCCVWCKRKYLPR